MPEIFLEISLVLGLAVLAGFLMRFFCQPLIVGYILSGVLISFILSNYVDFELLKSFSEIGVVLLLFMVGLGLNPGLVKEMGKVSILTGVGQIFFTTILGYFLALALGMNSLTAFYVAVAFTFSSTVIVVRLLHERGDTETLYGRISIGFLLVQDFFAMVFLIIISAFSKFSGAGAFWNSFNLFVLYLSLITLFSFLLMEYVIPKVDKVAAKNNELLFLFSLAVCFIIASIFRLAGFSMEMGALLAGVLLASSPYQREIASRIKPLRDFFLVIFFVFLGFNINLKSISLYWKEALAFSAFILIINPLIVWVLMKFLGYSKKTSFFAGLTVAQISEFSIILLIMGASLGHISNEIVGLGTLVGLITIAVSSYAISFADNIYKKVKPILEIFWLEDNLELNNSEKKFDIILFGCDRLGGDIMEKLKKSRANFLVTENNPEIVKNLEKKKINVEFGDADDWSFLESLPLNYAKLVISTIPDKDINLVLLRYLKKIKSKSAVVCVANFSEHAKSIYKEGAAYVVMPHLLGRKYIADLVTRFGSDKKKYASEKKKHLHELKFV